MPTCTGSWKKQESSRKASISALLTMPKPLTVWITINYGKLWKRRESQTSWRASWEICMQVRKQQLELDMEKQTGSKLGKWSRSVVSYSLRPMDCSLSGFSVQGIFQARVLEWIAISFSRGSSWPRNRTWVSCIAGRCFTIWATRERSTSNLYIVTLHI